jgi:hypothetical protein
MTDATRRKQLTTDYKRTTTMAGVYRIRNTVNGRALFGASTNLPSVGNRLAFARSTRSPGALDSRLKADIEQYGVDTFTFEILEVLEPAPESTAAGVRRDLAALEDVWRERLDPALLY